jgi:hypothetical protein
MRDKRTDGLSVSIRWVAAGVLVFLSLPPASGSLSPGVVGETTALPYPTGSGSEATFVGPGVVYDVASGPMTPNGVQLSAGVCLATVSSPVHRYSAQSRARLGNLVPGAREELLRDWEATGRTFWGPTARYRLAHEESGHVGSEPEHGVSRPIGVTGLPKNLTP